MGLLDSVLGGVLGAGGQQRGSGALMQIIAALLASRGGSGASGAPGANGAGGLSALVEQFQRGGLGDAMNSWIGTGPNQPVSPDQLGNVLGDDLVGRLGRQTGMNSGDLLGQLSQMLPQMVDQATPEGRIPEGGLGDISDISDIGAILGRFGQPR